MSRIRLGPGVIADLKRIATHLKQHEIDDADARSNEIIGALDVLVDNPLIGRPAIQDKRELVIGRGAHGYVALYRYETLMDTVFVLAIRAQREGSYARND